MCLTATWVLDEIRLTIRRVYNVLDIIEVYEYEVVKFDSKTREGGLFADYINALLKFKTEASGYPSWVRTPEDEERYVETSYAREGVRLNRDAIRPNTAKCGRAKLSLSMG